MVLEENVIRTENKGKINFSAWLNNTKFFFSPIFIKRIGILFIVLLILAGIGMTVYFARQHQTGEQHASSGTPFEGNAIYDSCGTSCLSRLDLFARGGFAMDLDYSIFVNTHIGAIQAFAQRAAQDNIKIIWSFKDFYPQISGSTPSQSKYFGQIAQDCGCNDWVSLTKYLVNEVKGDPATWGYYIADEPKNYSMSASAIGTVSNTISSLDPNHPRLLVNNDSLDNGNAGNSGNLANYVSVTDILAEDYYPVSYGQAINSTAAIANEVQYIANTYGKQSAMVLEVNSGLNKSGTAYPNLSQMQSMYNQVLQHSSPRLILWYWYPNTPAGQYENLLNTIHPNAFYGSCSTDPYDFCTTDATIGVEQYQGASAGNQCSINATNANAPRGQTVYCCASGSAQYGGCSGRNGQGKDFCTTSCSSQNIDYTGTAASDQCSINATKAGVTRGEAIYCSCFGDSCPVSPTSVPSPTIAPTAIPTLTPTAIPTVQPTVSPQPSLPITPSPNASNPADLNGDGKVDIVDYELLMDCYGSKFHTPSCTVGSKADIDGDGVVDGVDYNIWLRAFLSSSQ